MKKLISCFILCAMLLTVIPFSVSANTTVIEIGTPDEMVAFGEALVEGAYATGDNIVKLTDNIDMDGKTWAGKGTFSGTFDGQGYTISNLTITGTTEGTGLFGQATGILKNFNLVTANVTNTQHRTGIVVGKTAGELTVSNVNVCEAKLTSSSKGHVGGLIGAATYTTTVKNCFADIEITAGASVGGVVGSWVPAAEGATLTIQNCISQGLTNSSKSYGSGILGYVQFEKISAITISDCMVKEYTITNSDTSNSNGIGGIIGHLNIKCAKAGTVNVDILRCSVVGFEIDGKANSPADTGLLLGRLYGYDSNIATLDLDVSDVLLSGKCAAGESYSAATIAYIESPTGLIDISIENSIVDYTNDSIFETTLAYYAKTAAGDVLNATNVLTNGNSDAVKFSVEGSTLSGTRNVTTIGDTYDVSAWRNWTPASAFEDNLPRPTAVCADYVGYQVRDNDVRLVFGIRDVNVAALAELGAKITHGEQTATATVPAVYTQIKAGTNVCTAESVGYDYFYVIEFTDMFDGETTSYDFKFEATYKIGTKSYVNTTTDEVTVEKKQ
ncbi:MAG: hypothetical protein IJZ83_07100 [Clostridia bacterium]|nr:hypothetical protein [Clostridia bacterium]